MLGRRGMVSMAGLVDPTPPLPLPPLLLGQLADAFQKGHTHADLCILGPTSRGIEICVYLYQLPGREENGTDWCWFPVRDGFVLICTGLQRERDLCCTYLYQLTGGKRSEHICTSFQGERERFCCTYLCRLAVRGRFVHICASFS